MPIHQSTRSRSWRLPVLWSAGGRCRLFVRRPLRRAILSDLIARARAAGHHVLLGVCCSDAVSSIGLLESFGFTRVGHFREVGRKFDRWLDVVFLQLVL